MDGIMRNKKHEHGTPYIATTSQTLLRLITKKDDAKIDDFAGSIVHHLGYEHLILNPLKQLMTVSYGKFLTRRYLNKFIEPESWMSLPKFEWELFSPSRATELFQLLSEATFATVDIETDFPSDNRCITCLGITAVRVDPKRSPSVTAYTFVIPFTDDYNIAFIRQCMSTATFKVFQNGKFDIAYLLRFAIPVSNYGSDTINMFHSWYSELPKDLALLGAFCLRDWTYWKDEAANSIGSYEYYQYNAKDCFATAMIFLTLLHQMPEWAIKNLEEEFPVVYPCILSEATGFKIDPVAKKVLEEKLVEKNKLTVATIQTMVGNTKFNPNSPKQTQALWMALGSQDIRGTGKIEQDKVGSRHPINRRITDLIKSYRETSKLLGSYVAKDFVWQGRCLYTLNPHGTDTGRLSSRASHFNTGIPIQNIPREDDEYAVKDMFIADEGFYLFEIDFAQNETWSTAYVSGDKNLIATVEDKSKYFHAVNAEKFFGLKYEDLVESKYDKANDRWTHKKLNKALLDLAKRPNHGANYNMTASVLLDTMGIENTIRAKRLLGLHSKMSLMEVAQFMLDRFDETYPVVRGEAYDEIKKEIAISSMLVGATGWTRYCFSDPRENKRAMNMYAAHKSQSLSAMVLNQAYIRALNEVWKDNPNDFKLLAQVHDSIIGQYRIGRIDIPKLVAKCMDIHTRVVDIFGNEHDLNVPVDIKGEATRWSELKSI